MHNFVRWTIGLLLLAGTGPVCAQSLEADGTVTEISGDRIVIERDTSVSVSEKTRGHVFATSRLGAEEEQKIISGALQVQVVSGSVVLGQVTDRSDLMGIEVDQKVAFGEEEASPGTLAVRSTPEEARVELVPLSGTKEKNRQLGTTPVRTSVAPGRYRIRVSKEQYVPTEKTVRIRPGESRTLQPSLESRTGTLVVRPRPDTATVVVDGEPVGEGTVRTSLEVGSHEVAVKASGYTDATKRVSIEEQGTHSLAPTLDRKTGILDLSTTPEDATVRLDGSEVGATPVTQEVPVGKHTVKIQKKGYESATRSVVVSSGATKQVKVDLKLPIRVELASAKGPVKDVQMDREGGELIVQYGLTGSEEAYEVELELSGDGGQNYETIEEAVVGDVGDEVKPGSEKEIRWTVLQQYPSGISGGEYRLRVTAAEAFQAGGVTIQVMSQSEQVGSFGGLTLGWTGEGSYVMGSYNGATESVGFRAGPVWRQGWFSVQLISGLAYGDELLWQLGSGLHVGGSLYVGAEVLYMSELGGGEEAAAFLTLGVSL